MPTTYIALGSNINPEQNLQRCLQLLHETWPGLEASAVYQSPSLLGDEQDDYLNAVVKITTKQSLEEVHRALEGIEGTLGKQIEFPWGPRTIDLDLLLYDDLVYPDPSIWLACVNEVSQKTKKPSNLLVPHPGLHQRRFVLEPLCELIDTAALHPVLNASWQNLLQKLDEQTCTQVDLAPVVELSN